VQLSAIQWHLARASYETMRPRRVNRRNLPWVWVILREFELMLCNDISKFIKYNESRRSTLSMSRWGGNQAQHFLRRSAIEGAHKLSMSALTERRTPVSLLRDLHLQIEMQRNWNGLT
jgi:hypothetical protein